MVKNNIKKPLVSIITNTYNSSLFIDNCLESILNQTYSNWELIVADCGSTDDTLSKLSFYTDPRINIYPINFCGVSEGRNFGIGKAKGKYIAILDSDDICYPERLFNQVSLIESDKDCIAIGSGFNLFSSSIKKSKLFVYSLNYSEIKLLLESGYNPIPHSTLMFKKSIIKSLNIYNPEIEKSEDYDLILRLSNLGLIKLINQGLIYYRFSNTSHTNRHKPKGRDTHYFVVLSNLLLANSNNKSSISKKYIIDFMENRSNLEVKSLIFIWAFNIFLNNFFKIKFTAKYIFLKHLFSLFSFNNIFFLLKSFKKSASPVCVINNFILK